MDKGIPPSFLIFWEAAWKRGKEGDLISGLP
jgi:hypothetical protein